MSTVPIAVNDLYTVLENSANNVIDIRANDIIASSNPAQYRIQSLPTSGTLLVSVSDGSPLVAPVLNTQYDGPMEYTPDSNSLVTDTFTYDLINNIAQTSTIATVTLTIKEERPLGPIDWATILTPNGPQGGPNRIDPTPQRQEIGWLWGEKPDYEILNGWKYNVSQLLGWAADSVDRIDVSIEQIIAIIGQDLSAVPDAEEGVKGKASIATQSTVNAGLDDTQIVTSLKLSNKIAGLGGLVDSGSNANGYYRVYSDGFIEQWGTTPVLPENASTVVPLPISFVGTDYHIDAIWKNSTDIDQTKVLNTHTPQTSQFTIINAGGSSSSVAYWSAKGY